MRAGKSGSLMGVFVLTVVISLFPFFCGTAPAETEPAKKQSCPECHAAAADEIKAAGGKHRSVPCVGCHLGHPPTARKALQSCNRCHLTKKKAHFELGGCRSCHKNPHTPLNISFSDIKGNCVSCHAAQVAMLRENKSKHSAIECSTCHDVHRKVPECTRCHKPHATDMVVAECRECHKAHMPMPVTYAANIPSKDCGGCHRRALDLLSSSEAKHKPLACGFCHQEKHRMVPKCQSCHGSPHPEGMMAKFPKCGGCHKIAHDLNNWPAAPQKEAARK